MGENVHLEDYVLGGGYGCYVTRMGGRDVDFSGWGYGQMEKKSEPTGSIKFGEFLDWLRNC